MQLEGFFQLIRSRDISNAEIAWQIARGLRDAGEPGFEAFVKAVYAWGLSDIPPMKPVEFLMGLCNLMLKAKILRKTVIPAASIGIAPLVEHIHIEDIQTASFPTGFELLHNTKTFEFSTMTLQSLGHELNALTLLQALKFHSQYDFEILPSFVEGNSLQSLIVSSQKTIRLPDNLPALSSLKHLGLLLGARALGPVWDCQQLKSLDLADVKYPFSEENCHPFWEGIVNLQTLEELSFDIPYYSYKNWKMPSYVYELTNLKSLKILYKGEGAGHFTRSLMALRNLETLHVKWLEQEEVEWLADLPNFKTLYVKNKQYASAIVHLLSDWNSDITVIYEP